MKFEGIENQGNKPRAVFFMNFQEVKIMAELAAIAYRNAPNLPETLPYKTRVFNIRESVRASIKHFPPDGDYKEVNDHRTD